jgi:DNA polymerase I-like protein with 3'-5' exonuclease and polymerase domains
MLTIWTTTSKSELLGIIGVALQNSDFQVEVINDFTKVPDRAFVLCLGKEPLKVLEPAGLCDAEGKKFKKNSTISGSRNQLWNLKGNQRFLLSYSALIHKLDHGSYIDLICDVRTAARIAVTGKSGPLLGNYEYVSNFENVIAEIEAAYDLTGKPVDVCHDTETIGSDPFHLGNADRPAARFVTWQVSHKVGYSAVRYFVNRAEFDEFLKSGGYDQIKWLFTSPKVSMRLANGKFDMVWHRVHTVLNGVAIDCTTYKFDSTLVGSLLDENRSNSLDVHAKMYTNLGGYSDEFDRTIDKSRMDVVPKESMLPYAGGDTDAGLQCATAMKAELLKEPGLARFYINILHPATRAFEMIEAGGVCVDLPAYKELKVDVEKEIDTLVEKGKAIIGGRLFAKHRDESKRGEINLKKPSLLKDFLFSPTGLNIKPMAWTNGTVETAKALKIHPSQVEDAEPSTAFDDLRKIDHPAAKPLIDLLDDYGSATKTSETFIDGFLECLRSDSRYHPTYFLFKGKYQDRVKEGGTVTGRLSCVDPPFQVVPKHTKWGKRLRRCLVAPPGFFIGERDYAQGELKIVACVAEEQTMLNAYSMGMDLHVLTGSKIAGLTYEYVKALEATNPELYEKIRQPAKPANFGLLYGQGWEGFKAYAEANYGVKLTDQEAQNIRNAFFELYPRLLTFHDKMKELAHKNSRIVSPLGRIRHLPLIHSTNWGVRSGEERKAINSPIQATLSDMMIWALGLEWQAGIMKDSPCFGVIHDAAYDYLPEGNVEKFVKLKKGVMENLPFARVGWKPQLKFTVDYKVGANMGELKKIKIAA